MNTRFLRLIPLIVSSVVFVGCSSDSNSNANTKPTPTPDDPKTHAARQEEDFQSSGSAIEGGLLTEARKAVSDFVKSSLPGWTVKGMASQVYDGNAYSIDADLYKENRHAVVVFDVRKFFPDSGDPYWLAIPVNKFRADRLHDLIDSAKARQLQEAKDEIDNLQTPPDPEPEYEDSDPR